MRVRAAGEGALLVEVDALATVHRLRAALCRAELPGVLDIVPGYRTVLLVADPARLDLVRLAEELPGWRLPTAAAAAGRLVEVPVRYDGEDLARVAELTGMPVEEVVRRHAAAEYTVAFLGFVPGFPYLVGGDPALRVPRRETPRTMLPAGSVALADDLTGIYPRPTPGGWRLIGHTATTLFDPAADPPALLAPGDRVRFLREDADAGSGTPRPAAVGERADSARGAGPASAGGSDDGAPLGSVEVLRAGPLTTVQDLGRPGYGQLGVPRAGAVDSDGLRRANRLVGNPDGAAALEMTLRGPRLRFAADVRVALAGGATMLLDGAPVPAEAPVQVLAGQQLRVGPVREGLRAYLAVAGGVAVPPVLGSRSTDTLSGLGPPPLADGQWLPVGEVQRPGPDAEPPHRPAGGSSERAPSEQPPRLGAQLDPQPVPVLRITAGPREDMFVPEVLDLLTTSAYTVTPAGDRVGLRLAGAPLPRRTSRELPSEGLVAGSLQVPPDGRPILMLANHPTTGGYPVVAVVAAADLPTAAQLRPGRSVRFRLVDVTSLRCRH